MSIQPGANLYTQGFGSRPENVEIPVIANVAPVASNYNYPIGKRWIDMASNTEYVLTSISSAGGTTSATWSVQNIAVGGSYVGTATLVGGTVTVSSSVIAANSIIVLSRNTAGGTTGELSAPVGSITPGVSFVIDSTSGTDTSTVNYVIYNS